MKLAPESPFKPKWGRADEDLQDFLKNNAAPISDEITGYTAARSKQLAAIGGYFLRDSQAEVRRAFFSTYVQAATDQLNKDLGFPLTKRRSNVLTVDQVNADTKTVSLMSRDVPKLTALIAAIDVSNKDSDWMDKWKALTNRLVGVKTVSESLLDDTGQQAISCTISLAGWDTKDDGQRWRGRWRSISLETEGGANKRRNTNVAADQPLGDMPIDQVLKLKLTTDDPNDAPLEASTIGWGPIYLLQASSQASKRVEGWRTEMEAGSGKDTFTIPLLIQFARNLPPPAAWPAK